MTAEVPVLHRRILHNQIALSGRLRDGLRRRRDGFEILSSMEGLGYVFLEAPLAEPLPEKTPYVRVTPWSGITDEEMRALGFEPRMGMRYLTLTRPPPPPQVIPELEMGVVTEPGDLAHCVDIHIRTFMEPVADFERTSTYLQGVFQRAMGEPGFYLYLGKLKGVPVISGFMLLTEGVVGLFALATLPEYRNRKLGQALLERGVADALARGGDVVSLQVSAGLPFEKAYFELGFEEQFVVKVYTRQPRP